MLYGKYSALAELSIPDRYVEAQQCFCIGKYIALAEANTVFQHKQGIMIGMQVAVCDSLASFWSGKGA